MEIRNTPSRIKFEYIIALSIVLLAILGMLGRMFFSYRFERSYLITVRELEGKFVNVYDSEQIRNLSYNISIHSVNYFLTGDEEERISLIYFKEEFYRTLNKFKSSNLLTAHEEQSLLRILERAQDEKFEILKRNVNRPMPEKIKILLGTEVEKNNLILRDNLQKLVDIEVRKYREARSSLMNSRTELLELVSTVSSLIFITTIILGYILYRFTRKLRVAHTETLEAVRVRDEIMAIVSHDLKNPVSAISLNAQMLLRKTADRPELNRNIESIQHSVKIMLKLIHDILDYSKLEANRLQLEIQKEDFKDIVQETEELFIPQAKSKSIEIINTIPEHIPDVKCDKFRLVQILSNLLSNAIKFSGEGSKVEVKARPVGRELLVEIQDQGPGIPQEQLEHIFDRYWQAKKTAKLGTGLGLSIAEKLVKAHGGKIWVNSIKNKGTTFSFTVPLSV